MLDDETCRHCGGVDNWHHDLTECVGRLKSELALARKALAAAEEMRKDTCLGDALEAFDAAMAEVRKGEG